MPVKIATKGPKVGNCNICGAYGKLTEDHTPPKGCVKITQVVVHHISKYLSLDVPKSRGRLLNNGVKYRTLCHQCNNTLLGTKYDPCFIKFVNEVGSFLKTNIQLPDIMYIKTKPQRLMRALLGHISAQGVDRYSTDKRSEAIKHYFLNENAKLQEFINIYYWPYPFKGHVMARDCGYSDMRVEGHVVIWFLKFFPVGFIVTFNKPESYNYDSIQELSKWREETIDYEVEVPLRLRDMPHPYWPEAPNKDSMVLYGEASIVSFDLKKIKALNN